MVDITSRIPKKNRITETVDLESEDILNDILPPVNIPIPTFKTQTRPNAKKPDYSSEKTKRVGSDLPSTVHMALSLYCVKNEVDKGELILGMLTRLLRREKYLD